ncbi:hypothetical protein [Wolbachia endosymbiont (group A) of Agelastica alni]|uniref:hypothetical protein n=1 Tax=Wolbachia endosymbiont (group A) of Agelastica alni TaxID=3066130 RepID=UPI003132EA16
MQQSHPSVSYSDDKKRGYLDDMAKRAQERCHSSLESRKKEAGSQCLGTGMTKKKHWNDRRRRHWNDKKRALG